MATSGMAEIGCKCVIRGRITVLRTPTSKSRHCPSRRRRSVPVTSRSILWPPQHEQRSRTDRLTSGRPTARATETVLAPKPHLASVELGNVTIMTHIFSRVPEYRTVIKPLFSRENLAKSDFLRVSWSHQLIIYNSAILSGLIQPDNERRGR